MKRLLALLLFLSCSSAWATPALVNKWQGNGHAVTSCAATVSPSAGHNLIVGVNGSATATVTMSDSSGGSITWHTALAFVDGSTGGAFIGIYYAENIPGGVTTVTASFSATIYCNIQVAEVSGLATSSSFDKASTINGNIFSSSGSSTAVTPAATGEYAFAFIGNEASGGRTYGSWTGGFTLEDSALNTPDSAFADLVAGAGAVTAGTTISANSTWSMDVALFKPSAGASCTHAGYTSAGASSVPTAGVTSVYQPSTGVFGTVDCSSTNYYQLLNGGIGAN